MSGRGPIRLGYSDSDRYGYGYNRGTGYGDTRDRGDSYGYSNGYGGRIDYNHCISTCLLPTALVATGEGLDSIILNVLEDVWSQST
jgi:hypothetical protein